MLLYPPAKQLTSSRINLSPYLGVANSTKQYMVLYPGFLQTHTARFKREASATLYGLWVVEKTCGLCIFLFELAKSSEEAIFSQTHQRHGQEAAAHTLLS